MVRTIVRTYWRTAIWTILILGATVLVAAMIGSAHYTEPHVPPR